MARVEWKRGAAARVWRLGLAVCGLQALAALAQPAADTVILGGKVVTVDASFSLAEALAIDGGRIVAVGTSSEMRRYVGPATRVLDVGGATVTPGLIDNHFHFLRAVQRWHLQARLDGVDSQGACLDALRFAFRPAAEVLDRDYLTVPVEEIKCLRPTLTMVSGRVVYER